MAQALLAPPQSAWADSLEANLITLHRVAPKTAAILASATAQFGSIPTKGRDGHPTMAWMNADQQLTWLGRTSMPSISIPALLDSFQHGIGNVLLHPAGHPLEIRLLLDRMLPHQAVFLVEQDPALLIMMLRLADLSTDLTAGRLNLFAGPAAWDDFESFLSANPGYLIPERVLSRPWFTPSFVADLTTTLSTIANRVTLARQNRSPAASHCNPKESAPRWLILSNVASSRVNRLAKYLREAVVHLGGACSACTLDSPACVDPRHIQSIIDGAAPQAIVLLDAVPEALPYRLPPVPTAVLLSHDGSFTAQPQPGDSHPAWYAVRTPAQRDSLLTARIPTDRILVLPPAAAATWNSRPIRPAGHRIVFIADLPDATPAAVGLNLISHQHLWRKCDSLLKRIRRPLDSISPSHLLTTAERELGVTIKSEEVRDGLVTRIREVLIPAHTRSAFVLACQTAGIGFELFGDGWQREPAAASLHRATGFDLDSTLSEDLGLAVFALPTFDQLTTLIDLLAAGIPVAVDRSLARSADTEFLFGDERAPLHANTFESPEDLVTLLRSFAADPSPFLKRSAEAAHLIRAAHTWSSSLERLATVMGVTTPSRSHSPPA